MPRVPTQAVGILDPPDGKSGKMGKMGWPLTPLAPAIPFAPAIHHTTPSRQPRRGRRPAAHNWLVLASCLLALAAAACLAGCGRPFQPPADPSLSLDAAALMKDGDTAARRGDWPTAIANYRQARKASPKSHLPLYGLAMAYDRLGGRDLIAIAYWRAYLVSLPLGMPEESAGVLGRIDELDRSAADRTDRMVREARRMIDTIPPDIWWDKSIDRQALLKTLADASSQAQGGPPPRGSHRDKRGQPSEFAFFEASSWVALAELMQVNPSLAEPGTELKAAGGAKPERAAQAACSVALSHAQALRTLRDHERQWQTNWSAICPP